ncbi:hypothetical protein HY745_02835 [Candidatus Desantisbacteria bacterium]|nr:hypothetical protein [Candidatus Desantisbacteria bacterium]
MKYIKRPEIVQAFQWKGSLDAGIYPQWFDELVSRKRFTTHSLNNIIFTENNYVYVV